MPNEAEVHGLVALMEIQASRLRARVGPSGEPVLLLDQDRGRWDRVLIRRGLAALERAESLGAALGPYALQASIAACHARARTGDETDWVRIAALYAALSQITPSPVVELNRGVAVAMAFGPAAGLAGRRCRRRRAFAQELSSLAERARRFAHEARPLHRGTSRLRARRRVSRAMRASVSSCSNARPRASAASRIEHPPRPPIPCRISIETRKR